jgi:hypothetical protein
MAPGLDYLVSKRMSWRAGLEMYLDVVSTIDKYEMDDDFRLDLKARILDVFLFHDIDPSDLEDDETLGPILAKLEQINSKRAG